MAGSGYEAVASLTVRREQRAERHAVQHGAGDELPHGGPVRGGVL